LTDDEDQEQPAASSESPGSILINIRKARHRRTTSAHQIASA
jgi:hypothetical protein